MAENQSYHRENLRAELLTAGIEFVTSEGHATLSVRTLAQKVGVSPGAPYHHFPDRRSLLLAIAQEGFSQLIGPALRIVSEISDPMRRLLLLGENFMDFATSKPRLLELMYESELTRPNLDPGIQEALVRGYTVLRDAVAALLPNASSTAIDIKVVTIWSTLYGFASLRNRNMIQPFEPLDLPPNEVVQSVVRQAILETLAN